LLPHRIVKKIYNYKQYSLSACELTEITCCCWS